MHRNRRCNPGAVHGIRETLLVAVGAEHAGRNVVDSYPLLGDLARKTAHKVLLSGLCRRVDAHVWMRTPLVDRTDGYKPPPLLHLHLRIHPLEHPERRKEVYLNLPACLFAGEFRPRYLRLYGCIRDDDVGHGPFRLKPIEERVDRHGVGEVANLRVVAHDTGAELLERVAYSLADAARRARHERDSAGQVKFIFYHRHLLRCRLIIPFPLITDEHAYRQKLITF